MSIGLAVAIGAVVGITVGWCARARMREAWEAVVIMTPDGRLPGRWVRIGEKWARLLDDEDLELIGRGIFAPDPELAELEEDDWTEDHIGRC